LPYRPAKKTETLDYFAVLAALPANGAACVGMVAKPA
jgi:hypothetical protein